MKCARCQFVSPPIAAAGLSETERVLRKLEVEWLVTVCCFERVGA